MAVAAAVVVGCTSSPSPELSLDPPPAAAVDPAAAAAPCPEPSAPTTTTRPWQPGDPTRVSGDLPALGVTYWLTSTPDAIATFGPGSFPRSGWADLGARVGNDEALAAATMSEAGPDGPVDGDAPLVVNRVMAQRLADESALGATLHVSIGAGAFAEVDEVFAHVAVAVRDDGTAVVVGCGAADGEAQLVADFAVGRGQTVDEVTPALLREAALRQDLIAWAEAHGGVPGRD